MAEFTQIPTAIWQILSIIFTVLFITLSSSHAAALSTVNYDSEANALIKWKASLNLDNQSGTMLSSWTTATTPCNWTGISCDESMSVSSINVTSFGLKGTLHGLNFSSFPNLLRFDISMNSFYGTIPPQIGNLSRISHLNMSTNSFSGSIPQEIVKLANLSYLILEFNQLEGYIPEEIRKLGNLKLLWFASNKLSGFIPPTIGMLKNLVQLQLYTNNLIGPIPSTIGNLKQLEILYLYDNNLSGPIPNELGTLHSLKEMDLGSNSLSGPIPLSIGDLTNLNFFQLMHNHLHGPIPSTLANLTKLTYLTLAFNSLSGSIPAFIGNFVNLQTLDLALNNLSGPIPSNIGNLTNLIYLDLLQNKLNGSMPPSMNNLTNLQFLVLGLNDFIGPLPQDICLGGYLQNFSAYVNHFTGPVPRSLRNCPTLVRVNLHDNHLTGNISNDFGVYPILDYIDLSSNKFYGHLSSNWGKCNKLTALKISYNNLSGSIPLELGEATNLRELDLSSNHLTGKIPKELRNLTLLNKLSMSNNQLSGNIPNEIGSMQQLRQLELAANNLSGSIPNQVGELINLLLLNLSWNKLENNIPLEFGQLRYLEKLDLSRNLLSGNIPTTLGKLQMLEMLNLSENNFSGTIPSSFDGMLSLTSVNISYNQLHGSLPNNPAFHNARIESLKNNKGLCGNVPGLVVCSKVNDNSHHQKIYKVLLIALSLCLGTSFLVVVVVLHMFRRSARKKEIQTRKPHTEDVHFLWNSDREIMYENIIEATEDFDEKYVIGEGGQGKVYKAKLETGEFVAVKKLHSVPSGDISNLKAFQSELRALTEVKHRNIVKLYGFCSHSNFSSLIYEFLEGGSLDKILSNDTKAHKFDWNKRVNVVKNVANALSYMHHQCSFPIVHRDISSKNILLDSDYEAHLSDFGTAKFLNPNSQNMTTFAGTFGYAAPEIAYKMEANEKCDVYSFGVLSLEILMGEHPGDFISSLWASTSATSATYNLLLNNVLDQRLSYPIDPVGEQVILIAKIAFDCLCENPDSRPTMEQLSQRLLMLKSPFVDQFSTITIGQLLVKA